MASRLAFARNPENNPGMTKRLKFFCAALVMTAALAATPADAQYLAPLTHPPLRHPPGVPFTDTLSNTTPLVFGMAAPQAAFALQSPLTYISGRPGEEIFVAHRPAGNSFLFQRSDRLYLQFRRGRLTGWKGDWGHNWMWQ